MTRPFEQDMTKFSTDWLNTDNHGDMAEMGVAIFSVHPVFAVILF
jgi:hypothetical protein